MGQINIANSVGRDAVVAIENVQTPTRVRWLDKSGRQAGSTRVVKGTIDHDISGLTSKYGGLDDVADAIVDGDPEVDFENTGRFLHDTSRVYVDENGRIVHTVQFFEIVTDPDGVERERRPRKVADTNVSGELPLRWSGVYVDKQKACHKFVFTGKVQLHHINGLTYDFLYSMAKELESKNSLMLLGAGSKSKEPLILRRAGTPYRGFLEGRTDGDKYCLLLHFSNMELKAPPTVEKEGGQ